MPWMILLAALAALLLSGCNLNDPNLPTPNADNLIVITATQDLPTPDADGVIYITATPQTVSQASPPTAELPPTVATATPTLPPVALDTLISQADQQLRNGYFEEAAQTYRTVLAQGSSAPASLRAETAFRLGQASLREGLFADAVAALTELINQFPEDSRVAQAYFLRGDAYLGLSQWADAIADFQQYLTLRPELVDSYAYERIADAQLAQGQFDLALGSYDLAIAAGRPRVPLLVLREKLAQILINAGRVEAGVAQYDAILAVARNAPYRASIELMAARALLEADQTESGVERARRIVENYLTTASAYPAVQILLENDVEIDGWRRGRASYQFGDYAGAIEAFNEYTSSFQLDAIPAELYLLLGRAYREIDNPDAAFVAFQTIVEQFPTDPLFGEALLEQGRTRFLSDDIPAAIETYLNVADTYSYLSETAAEALWRVGYLYGTRGNPTEARQIFVRLAQEFPQSEWAASGLSLAASSAVTAEEWEIAENLYGRMAVLATGDDQAAAYLWVGRLAMQRGDMRAAEEAFGLTIQSAPDSYFAARASDIRAGREPFTPPTETRFDFDTQAARSEAENWLRERFAVDTSGDLSELSESLTADGRFIRGSELWELGVFDEAQTEFYALLDDLRAAGDGVGSYQMAVFLRELGAYRASIVAAADTIIAAGASTSEAPAYLGRMRYPAYYIDLVREQATRYELDVLLMLSLIRQESLFDTTAVSVADAIGLMQVIPSTGQYIANQLGWPDWQASDLTYPYVGIAFGAYYLDEQLRLFDGNAAAALAAYNAGPGRALDWNALAGGEVDLLLTTITFEETRMYLERIYSHYNIYRQLYGA